ncbi:MAG: hypothetical protein R3F33_05855 [Planctomycetota bacterium]
MDSTQLAENFLQEAVYRSRGAQAGRSVLDPDGKSQCGLGREAAIELDLTPEAERLAGLLWPTGLAGESLAHVRQAMAAWIEQQDQLDRKRNHFLKAFRNKHGFRRADYSPEQIAAYDSGLELINAEAAAARLSAAIGLLECE